MVEGAARRLPLASFAFPDAVGVLALNRILELPLLVRTHGSDINLHAPHRPRAAQLRWLGAEAQGVICVSRALAQRVIETGIAADKVHVIPNGVDLAAWSRQVSMNTR